VDFKSEKCINKLNIYFNKNKIDKIDQDIEKIEGMEGMEGMEENIDFDNFKVIQNLIKKTNV
jgi:hypothetical protein